MFIIYEQTYNNYDNFNVIGFLDTEEEAENYIKRNKELNELYQQIYRKSIKLRQAIPNISDSNDPWISKLTSSFKEILQNKEVKILEILKEFAKSLDEKNSYSKEIENFFQNKMRIIERTLQYMEVKSLKNV